MGLFGDNVDFYICIFTTSNQQIRITYILETTFLKNGKPRVAQPIGSLIFYSLVYYRNNGKHAFIHTFSYLSFEIAYSFVEETGHRNVIFTGIIIYPKIFT